MSDLINKFSWIVIADDSPKWGRKTTKEEKEEMKKEKHTPGKKKKRGRSKIKVDPSPGRYAGRSKPSVFEEKGKKCGRSYIAKEDECSIGKDKLKKSDPADEVEVSKKPPVKKAKDDKDDAAPLELPPDSPFRPSSLERPEVVNSPEGGPGKLVRDGYLASKEDGIYALGSSSNLHRIYFPTEVEQAKAQYLSCAIAAVMGLPSFNDYLFKNEPIDDKIGTGHKILPFSDLDELQLRKFAQGNPEVAGWFVHAVLVRNDSVVGENFNNMVLKRDGHIVVLHFGGTLLWAFDGSRRHDGMAPNALPEFTSLRSANYNWQSAAIFGWMTDNDIRQAITKYLVHVDSKDILSLIDASQFNQNNRIEIGKGLISRKHLLEAMIGN